MVKTNNIYVTDGFFRACKALDLIQDCINLGIFETSDNGERVYIRTEYDNGDVAWEPTPIMEAVRSVVDNNAFSILEEAIAKRKQEQKAFSMSREVFEQKCYEAYQLNWMINHSYSVNDLLARIGNIAAENTGEDSPASSMYNYSVDALLQQAAMTFIYDVGFDGNMWVCKEEFINSEFKDPEYMKFLTSMMPHGKDMFNFYLKHYTNKTV